MKLMDTSISARLAKFDSDMQTSLSVLKDKDKDLTDTIEDLSQTVQRIQTSLSAVESKLDMVVGSTLPTLSERVASIEAIAKQNDRRLEIIETESDRVKRTGVTRDELDSVRTMLFELQGSVMQNSGKVLELVTQLSSIKKTDAKEL